MKPTTTTVPSRASISSSRGIAWGLATLALLASSGCNRSKRTYPTISARNPDGGNVSVHGIYNHCPDVFFSASPDHASVGQTISLSASASDEDGDPLTYAWMASAGTIDKPDAATTTYHCVTRAAVVLTLAVSDGSCTSTTSGQVLCQSADAGADDGGGAGGAGGAAGSGSQAGTGGSLGGAAGTGGTAGAAGTGGPGTGGAVGAAGTTGTGGTGAGGGGGTACVETSAPPTIAAACAPCLTMNINPATDGCCKITDAAGLQACQAASACMRGAACTMAADPTPCFCGDHMATCDQPGQADGPCVSQISAAAARNITTMMTDSPSAAQVLQRQADPNYAYGRAANIFAIAGGFCPDECGIGQ